jgi:hypothetical protein
MQMSDMKVTEQIEQRAYELYLERGGEDGRDLDDWLAAEKELMRPSEQSSSSTPKTRAAAAGFQATSAKAGRTAEETPVEIANK